jgi:hypothetical protein
LDSVRLLVVPQIRRRRETIQVGAEVLKPYQVRPILLRTTGCVTPVTVIARCACSTLNKREKEIMTRVDTYKGWWDTSLIDERSERALLSAFVAGIVVWAAASVLALV